MGADAIQRISDMGIPTVGVHYDAQMVSHRAKRTAPVYDLYWVIDPPAVDKMRALGANVYDAPVAANPHVYRPQDIAEDVEVSFCGQRYGSRIYYMEELFRAGLEIEIFGGGWRTDPGVNGGGQHKSRLNLRAAIRHTLASMTHSHGRAWLRAAVLNRLKRASHDPTIQRRIDDRSNPALSFPDMIRLFSRSKVTLDFNELGNTHLLSKPLVASRLRDFEALASGACHLMYRVPAIEPHFEEDKEILYYSSVEELTDKIRYYTDEKRDGVRADIRSAARVRSLRDHTWTQRFDQIFDRLGIKTG
jgi:spore maturation protein CgeB